MVRLHTSYRIKAAEDEFEMAGSMVVRKTQLEKGERVKEVLIQSTYVSGFM